MMRQFVGFAGGVGLLLASFVLVQGQDLGVRGQEPPAKSAQTEQDKQKKGAPKEEEERTPKSTNKAPLRVGDEEGDGTPVRAAARGADLTLEANSATNPAVKELFEALSPPHDLWVRKEGLPIKVETVPIFIPPGGKPPANTKVKKIGVKRNESIELQGITTKALLGFEQVVLQRVDEFLKLDLDKKPAGDKLRLSRIDMLQEAEKALVAGILYNRSAREQGKRDDPMWADVSKQLEARLVDVQLQRLRLVTEAKDWDKAFALAATLVESHPARAGDQAENRKIRVQIMNLLARQADDAVKEKKYTEARRRLWQLQEQFPSSPELEQIRAEIRKQGEELLKQARQLIATNPAEARNMLRAVQEIDPHLGRDETLKLNKQYPILTVGVRSLPVNISPALAVTDSEKQALDLVFESLLKLAIDLPDVVPLGRRFQLPRDAFWNDGQALRASAVRHTIQLMSDKRWAGRDVEWSKLIDPRASITDDPFKITLTFGHGYIDPLALMDFKVLPESLDRIDKAAFATNPIGSGPYQFKGRTANDANFPEKCEFHANPQYGARANRTDLPLIREIHLVKAADAALAFREGGLGMLFDPPSAKFKELQAAGINDLVNFKTLPNRRIYFLALNHRNNVFQNEAFRRGLANVIKRDEILDSCFRKDLAPPPHRALTGPYPPGSWACKPEMQAYNFQMGMAQLEKSKANRAGKQTLSLKYPDDDPAVAEACALMKKQIEAVDPSLTIELASRTPEQLHREVEIDHDYQMAYYHHDFANESFWLWPLFHTGGEGAAENFLGYKNDGELAGLLRKLMGHRNPKVVQELAWQIHQHCFDKVPFVPLWQLDTHLVTRQNLALPAELDPLAIFRDVEQWRLGPN
jgi:peptide/nickel transport system substrate-binding protein